MHACVLGLGNRRRRRRLARPTIKVMDRNQLRAGERGREGERRGPSEQHGSLAELGHRNQECIGIQPSLNYGHACQLRGCTGRASFPDFIGVRPGLSGLRLFEWSGGREHRREVLLSQFSPLVCKLDHRVASFERLVCFKSEIKSNVPYPVNSKRLKSIPTIDLESP